MAIQSALHRRVLVLYLVLYWSKWCF